MKKIITTLAFASLSLGATQATIVVQEDFTYANGNVASLNGGTGWASAWEAGNSTANTRFTTINNKAIYVANGSKAAITQNRTFASAITVGANDTVTLKFNLIWSETQAGRGIGINLTNGGVTQYFIGKKINGQVGLHAGMTPGSDDYGVFATSGTLESITATFTYDGTETSIVMSDSDEILAAYTFAGKFTFDGIGLTGYHGATVSNGIDQISIDVTSAQKSKPSPAALLDLGGLTLILRRH
jgi:hypothetical protein